MSVGLRRVRGLDVPPVAVPLVVATVTRLALVRPLWGDEQITLRIAAEYTPVEIVIAVATHQPHLPTYYLLVEALTYLPTPTVALARALSLAASLATVAVTHRLGVVWFDEETAVVAALLLALSPVAAVQASWVRMYALFGLAATASWWALTHHLRARTHTRAYLATTLAAVALHPYGVFLAPTHAAWAAWTHREWRYPVLATTLSTPVVAYLAVKAVAGFGPSSGVRHVVRPPPLHEVTLAPLATLTGSLIYDSQTLVVGLVAGAILVTLPDDWPTSGLQAAVAWIAVPLAAATVISYTLQPMLMLKYLGFLAPAVALVVADRCLAAGPPGRVVAALLVVIQTAILWLAFNSAAFTVAREILYGLAL